MKKSRIFFATVLTALVSIPIFDQRHVQAEVDADCRAFAENPDNVELVIPPTSPDALKTFDGITVISYVPEGESSSDTEVAGRNGDGKNGKLPGPQPDQIVKATLTLGSNRAGRTFEAVALDGGILFDTENGIVADDQGKISFTFQVGHHPGLYQVALYDGSAHEIGIQFWVVNNENSEANPKVDLPPDATATLGAPATAADGLGNDNPT